VRLVDLMRRRIGIGDCNAGHSNARTATSKERKHALIHLKSPGYGTKAPPQRHDGELRRDLKAGLLSKSIAAQVPQTARFRYLDARSSKSITQLS